MSKTPPTKPIDLDTAPRSAFRFAATAKLADQPEGETPSADGVLTVPFELVARTKAVINHWYWGPIIHDFAGMTHRDSIAVDMHHSYGDPVGFANQFNMTDEGLVLGGSLVALVGDDDDEAAKLIKRGRAGVPYQGSIDFDPQSVVLEYVPEGMMSEANGEPASGPVTIMRQWDLLGVAVCLHGIDGGTEARFSRDAKDVPQVPISWKGKLSMTTNATPAAGDSKPSESIEDVRGQWAKTREKFTGMFGVVDGNEYLAKDHSYEVALETHLGKLSKQLTDEKARADAAEQKLAAAQFAHGEPGKIDTSVGKGEGNKATGLLGMIKPAGSSRT